MSKIIDYCLENGFLSFNIITDTLYKYVNVETAKLILQNSTLKFSTADEFNDPFELTCEGIDVRASNQDVKELIKRTHSGTTKEKKQLFKDNIKNKSFAEATMQSGAFQIVADYPVGIIPYLDILITLLHC